MKKKLLALSFVGIATFTACGGGTGSTPETVIIEPTLASIQKNIFTPSCALAGCHADRIATSNDLSLADGESLRNLRGQLSFDPSISIQRLQPGSPTLSYLVLKLEGDPNKINGERMPKDRSPLSTQQISAIKEWITNGSDD